ncbi:acetyltransferase [Gottschalkia purinilytica]|uniref:Acetyltransferase n=1 Tax=Gottschalkia purinilytica TaxID=1503 RepID=A0A0L0WBX5_GOTPU|nr:GNAT family N-acetyltransferase [Gottschalkia purinilytica]KNF08971.1 acetyltransferase [Gottschalkia purinilytica]
MESLNIRGINSVDIERLIIFLKELENLHGNALPNIFKISEDIEHIREYISNSIEKQNPTFFIAELEEEIIGVIEVIITENPSNPILINREYALIDKLIVKEEYRKLGVAKKLIETVETWLKEKGIKEIEIYVWEFNKGALDLYENKGFETICRRMIKSI